MKKSTYLIALALGASTITFAQNVGINTDGTDPDSDALLHVKDNNADSSVVRVENEQSKLTKFELRNPSAKWDLRIPTGETDLRINNGSGQDHVTIQNDGDVGIGTTTPKSTLDIQGSMGLKVNTITSAQTLGQTHNVILCSSTTGPYTVTLPPAATNTNKVYYIKNIDEDGDVITLECPGSTIDGYTTYDLDSYLHVVRVVSDGTNWYIIDEANKSTGGITGLTCGASTDNGTLEIGQAASSVSSDIPYTGGNGGTHNGQIVTSTGVIGLTATLAAGSFATGAGSVNYTITGTPASTGTASFAIDIGGQTCTLTRTVYCSTQDVTFTYDGASVTYGVVRSSTDKCWMDRNLGATQVATSSTDANSYGDLFQWGRGDDGHQDRSSGTTSTNADSPGHGNFITEPNSPWDWRVNQDNNLWNGESATNNPCPSGWRIPTGTEWEAERNNGGTGFWGTGSLQNNSTGAMNSVLKLPMAGARLSSNGSLFLVGTTGYYWSSTVSGTDASRLLFNSSDAYLNTNSRASGYSVRCLKD